MARLFTSARRVGTGSRKRSHLPIIRLRLSIIILNMADSSSARFSLTVSFTTPFFMSIIIASAPTIWTTIIMIIIIITCFVLPHHYHLLSNMTIFIWSSDKAHYASRPSVRLSVCLFVCPIRAPNWKTKLNRKTGMNVTQNKSNQLPV